MRQDANEDQDDRGDGPEYERRCPYCSAEGTCAHILLTVDVTFRVAEDGPLSELFNHHWSSLLEQHDDDGKWDERIAFDELLELVDGASDSAPPAEDFDGAPGQSSTIQRFYCESAESLNAAVSRLHLAFDDTETEPPQAAPVKDGYFSEEDLPDLRKRWPGITLEEANAIARTGGG